VSRLLSTREIAQALKARPREVFALAHQLGLNPGAEVAFDSNGEPVSRRVWPSEWVTELRAELARQDEHGIDIDDLCTPDGDVGTRDYNPSDPFEVVLRALGILA
jgi:sulfur carrier protein ThiS